MRVVRIRNIIGRIVLGIGAPVGSVAGTLFGEWAEAMTRSDVVARRVWNERRIEAFYDGPVALASGAVLAQSDRWETERLHDGLKLIVVEAGSIRCKMSNLPRQKVVGPCVCATWNRGDHEAAQLFSPGQNVRYTTVTLSAATVEGYLAANPDPLRPLLEADWGPGPSFSVAPASRPILGLCAQVSALRLEGLARTLFLSGKALEIAALAISSLGDPTAVSGGPCLGSAEVEKLHKAKAILEDRLVNPPSLAELGLAVGLNVRKLTSGFRRVFGTSVHAHVQAVRLDTAYRLLVEGDLSVSSVAYRVGYSPPHFSVAFRKRFGVSPKTLKA